MGLRLSQLPLRMARNLDYRHLRSSIAAPVYLPSNGVDLTGCWSVFPDSEIVKCPLRPRGTVYLLGKYPMSSQSDANSIVCGLLFSW